VLFKIVDVFTCRVLSLAVMAFHGLRSLHVLGVSVTSHRARHRRVRGSWFRRCDTASAWWPVLDPCLLVA